MFRISFPYSCSPRGFIDVLLDKQKRTHRGVLTVPTFLLALAIVAGSDLLATVPRNLLDVHGNRLGLASTKIPAVIGNLDPAYVVASRAALLDAGVAWLFSMFEPEHERQ